MIGERLESHYNLPSVAFLLLVAGLGLAAAGLICGFRELVPAAVLPLAVGGSLWFLGQERPFTATFREEGLEIESAEGPILVRYASIQNIKVGGRPADPLTFSKPSCAIAVVREGGVVRIPSRLNYPSHEVYRYLAGRVSGSGGRNINPVLCDYLERQERSFGSESVWTFRAASHRVTGARLGYRAFCIGLLVAGAAWSVFGLSGLVAIGWVATGIVCVVVAGILYAAELVPRPYRYSLADSSPVPLSARRSRSRLPPLPPRPPSPKGSISLTSAIELIGLRKKRRIPAYAATVQPDML